MIVYSLQLNGRKAVELEKKRPRALLTFASTPASWEDAHEETRGWRGSGLARG